MKRRPGGVTFAGWLMGINGAFSAIGGVIVLIVASNTQEMARHGLPQGALLVTGFVVLTLGLLELLLVYALFGGSNAARIITTVVFGVSLLFSLTSVLTRQPGALFAWVTGLVDVIVLVGLWGTPGATEFFDSGRAPSTRAAAPVAPATSPVSGPVGVPRRHRRPSGEPPPLPPEPDTRWWVWFGGVVLLLGVVVATLFRRPDPFHDAGDTILRWFADHEGTTAVNIAKALNALTAVAVVMSARVAIVAALALYKRWRHLVVALATFVVSDFLVSVLLSVERPSPTVPALVSAVRLPLPVARGRVVRHHVVRGRGRARAERAGNGSSRAVRPRRWSRW